MSDIMMKSQRGLISHNSVTLRNVIFHCIEHNNKISVALVDIKQTEFYPFKGMNGVVAVANSVQEAAEILRIGRSVMYSRNKKMQKMGLPEKFGLLDVSSTKTKRLNVELQEKKKR